jgi:hypothetical protein
VETLQELWAGFNAAKVAYLDLAKVEMQQESGLVNAGPWGCVAGDLHLVPGQLGASSQVLAPHKP